MGVLGYVTKRMLSGSVNTVNKAGKIAYKAADVTSRPVFNAATWAGSSFFQKEAGRTASNFYTGHKMSGPGNWTAALSGAGIGIAGAYGSYQAYNNWGVGTAYQNKAMGQVAYSGGLPSQAYDGSGNVNSATGKRDFGATGDLVLAMSANRRG